MIIHDVKQGSIEWFALRLGKVTGSTLKDAISDNYLSVIDRIIAERETDESEDSDYISEDMQRGNDLEPFARIAYERFTGNKITQVGFIQHLELYDFFGISSDGIHLVDSIAIGAVEIKCPKTKTHVKRIRQNQLPNEYKLQALSHFVISPTIEWVDFVSYDDRFAKKPLFIHRTLRSHVADEINAIHRGLIRFESKLNELTEQILF